MEGHSVQMPGHFGKPTYKPRPLFSFLLQMQVRSRLWRRRVLRQAMGSQRVQTSPSTPHALPPTDRRTSLEYSQSLPLPNWPSLCTKNVSQISLQMTAPFKYRYQISTRQLTSKLFSLHNILALASVHFGIFAREFSYLRKGFCFCLPSTFCIVERNSTLIFEGNCAYQQQHHSRSVTS